MAIVTIFGATFGDDEMIARGVAKTLGWRHIGRELLVDAAERCDVPQAKLNEILDKEPHWWARWLENLRPYRIALQSAVCEAALADNLVYHGHLGHALLPNIRHVLRVLITAPLEYRLDQVRAREGLDPKAASHYLDQVERARTRRLNALFDLDWQDAGQYALVLNLAQMSVSSAITTIARVARLDDYQPTVSSERALANLALTTRIQAMLLRQLGTPSLLINVQSKEGKVQLGGTLSASIADEEIRMLVETVPGVEKVLMDFETMRSEILRYG